jgi:DNA-binding NarL/FixJ family response regulator
MDRVLIADDHPMVRGALALAVEAAFGRCEIVECDSLDDLLRQLEQLGSADLMLVDLRMPGLSGVSDLLKLRHAFPETPVVVISALEDRQIIDQAMAIGAAGFIPKSTPRQKIIAALHQIAAGELYVPGEPVPARAAAAGDGSATGEVEIAQRLATLTAQQARVLRLLGMGKLNKQIAYELDIAEATVKVHVSAILQKLDVCSRTQAVVLAGRLLSTERLIGDGFAERERRPVLASR